MTTLLFRFSKTAKADGRDHPYLFLNHCFETQKPMLGYGPRALQRLHQTRRAVEPDGVFQQLQEAPHLLGLDGKVPEDDRLTKEEL